MHLTARPRVSNSLSLCLSVSLSLEREREKEKEIYLMCLSCVWIQTQTSWSRVSNSLKREILASNASAVCGCKHITWLLWPSLFTWPVNARSLCTNHINRSSFVLHTKEFHPVCYRSQPCSLICAPNKTSAPNLLQVTTMFPHFCCKYTHQSLLFCPLHQTLVHRVLSNRIIRFCAPDITTAPSLLPSIWLIPRLCTQDLARNKALETDGVWVTNAMAELALKEPGEKQKLLETVFYAIMVLCVCVCVYVWWGSSFTAWGRMASWSSLNTLSWCFVCYVFAFLCSYCTPRILHPKSTYTFAKRSQMCLLMCVYIHIYICVCVCIYMYIYIYIYMHVYICIYTNISTYMFVWHVCVSTHTCICMCGTDMHRSIHVCE